MAKETARFRVSDTSTVPLRGTLVRLTLLEGDPQLKDLKKAKLRLTSPSGESRVVQITDFFIGGGRMKQSHMDSYRMLDVIISNRDASGDGEPVGIGWAAEGPV